MPNPSAFEDEMSTEKIKRRKAPDVYQIPAYFIQTENGKIRSEIHKPTNSVWNKQELPEE
jgi:hypothetical protein